MTPGQIADENLVKTRNPERLAGLRRLNLLDTPAEEAFDRISSLAARTLDAPVALVSLVDADRQFFKSCIGLPEPYASLRETPLRASFCKHVVEDEAPIVLDDAREHPMHRLNAAIEELNAVAYLGYPLKTREGHILGTLCAIHHRPHHWTADEIAIVRDLSALVMTEIELRAQAVETATALRAREQILGIVSHDLRAPLQTIVTAAAFLAEDLEDAESLRNVDGIREGVRRMNRLIGDLLDVNALEFGQLGTEKQRFDIDTFLSEFVDTMQDRARAEDLDLECHAAASRDVEADPDRLLQVLANLLDNALRLTPAGGRIDVSARHDDGDVRIAVADTGPGIPEAEIGHIFDWYWHVRHRNKRGTGLGLAIARGIVEMHGGRLDAGNCDGGGAVFTFTLPSSGTAEAGDGAPSR